MLTETAAEPREQQRASRATMKAAVFVAPGRIELQDRPIPKIGSTDVLLRVTTTTICGADVHILKGEHSFTHRYKLDQIEEAYDLCTHQRDGVLKVAITP